MHGNCRNIVKIVIVYCLLLRYLNIIFLLLPSVNIGLARTRKRLIIYLQTILLLNIVPKQLVVCLFYLSPIHTISFSEMTDTIIVLIEILPGNIIIGCVYGVPCSDMSLFLTYLDK